MTLQSKAALAGALLLGVLLALATLFDAKVVAMGWLIAFFFWGHILIGSLTLIMIHRLTGGRWGEIITPVIAPAAAAVPFLIILAVPLFVAIPVLYPWSHHPQTIKPDVLSYYLNAPSFIIRAMLALIGWSALAFFLPRLGERSGQILAALGLVFHALVISTVSVDWYLSLEAPFTSSSFGASIAISSLVGALSWAALLMPATEGDTAIGDVGGLLLSTVLGITYIDFMAVLVIWYGDLPREELWFVKRESLPWTMLAIVSFLLTSLLPVLALLLAKVRNARCPLGAVGACVLAGLACYGAYLIAPPAGGFALVTGLTAIAAIGLSIFGKLSGANARFFPSEAVNVR